jgi:cytosine/adenosine deaminase-related metal-dependent hydrolase
MIQPDPVCFLQASPWGALLASGKWGALRMSEPAASPPMPGRHAGPVLLKARWVVGHEQGRHILFEQGEVVFEGGRILFVGHGYGGPVAQRHDFGDAIIAPGFIDLDALSDLDTTVLAFDNHPEKLRGRVWPRSYMKAGPFEMYAPEELVFQKRYAFAQLLLNGITTAAPIASLFYRAWGETIAEFEGAAEAADALGLRAYLGPAYRTGNAVVDEDGSVEMVFDADRGLAGLDEAIRFAERIESRGGLLRAMLAPDRIEGCTPELLRRSAAAARDLDCPIRLHACQGDFDVAVIRERTGMPPIAWLNSLGFLSPHVLIPHLTHATREEIAMLRDAGGAGIHCPLVAARFGDLLDSFQDLRASGLTLAMGTDTWPPDMILNMQMALLTGRMAARAPEAMRAEDPFDAATLGGAAALRRPDLGRLAAGAAADIIVIALGLPHHGQVIDPIQTLMLSGRGRDIRHVIVDGRFVVVDGAIPGFDEAAETERAQAQFEKMMALYPQRTLHHPPVEEIFSTSYPVRRPIL